MTLTIILIVAAVLTGLILVPLIVGRFLIVVPPNRVLVISGRSRTTAEGERLGYRVIRGGRALCAPMLEKVAWMDLTTIPLDLSVENAYSKGGIPLRIHAVANVKINAHDPLLGNAIERFLDVPREALTSIVRDTLEGNLRGVIATLSPEEINQDRLRFAETLLEEAEHDMNSLGIKLDTLKIQNVSDANGYLDSIGRRQTAEVLKTARISEAERNAEATEAEAQAKQRVALANTASNQMILERDTELRMRRAALEGEAGAREAQARVQAEQAKVVAEQQLEAERVKLQQIRLEADVVAPARAAAEKAQLDAVAAAAPIIAEGKAKAEAVAALISTFEQHGGERAYILNMLPGLVHEFAEAARAVRIDKLSVFDSGSGQATQSAMQNTGRNILGMVEQVETVTGVQLLSALREMQVPGAAATEGVSSSND